MLHSVKAIGLSLEIEQYIGLLETKLVQLRVSLRVSVFYYFVDGAESLMPYCNIHDH